MTANALARSARRPRRAPPASEAAVTDVLGSILLVGITVVAAAGLGLLILSFDGPADVQYSRMAVTLLPGTGGWGTGDEELRLTHLGGEALRRGDATIRYTPPSGIPVVLTGTGLTSGFSDGELTIGETWSQTLTAQLNDRFDVQVIVGAGRSQLLADASAVAGSAGGGALCLGDITPPTAAFQQSPADVNSLSSGAITVTLTLSDNCAGVDETAVPHLFWCVAAVCTQPTSYADAGAMTDTGLRTWSANIPAQVWLTQGIAGASVRYYATAMTDLNGNVAQSAVQADLVDLLYTYTYVASANAVTGGVSNLANAQSAADGVETDVAEGAVSGTPTTVGPTKYSGTAVTNSGALNPNNALASDDARTEFDTTGDFIELTGIDLPANAATVTAVTIGYEGRKASSGGTSPTSRLDYKIGAGAYSTGSSITETSSTDVDRTRTLSGTFSVSDVEAMTVRVFYVTDTNRNLQVDRAFITVTYQTAATTNYATNVELEWTGVPVGALQNIDLRYRVAGDTFTVQVWSFTGLSWRTCTGSLTSASLTSFSCGLVQPGEYLLGEVRIRFVDATPSGTTQGHVYLDHARVGTV